MAIKKINELRFLITRITRHFTLFYRRTRVPEIRRRLTLNAVGYSKVVPFSQTYPGSFLLGLALFLKPSEEEMADVEEKAPADTETISASEALYDKKSYREEYNFLLKHQDSTNAEIQWRLVRAARNLAQLSATPADEKKQLTYQALEYAKKALELDESNFATHKWYAISLSDVGDYEGNKAKLLNAYEMRDHFKKAIELNPKEATSRYLLGLWCFTFADMPWYQRKLASAIFATPPTATYEECLGHFKDAEELDPNFYSMNLLMMGKTMVRMKDKDNARLWLQKAVDFKAETEEDQKAQDEAKQLLKGL